MNKCDYYKCENVGEKYFYVTYSTGELIDNKNESFLCLCDLHIEFVKKYMRGYIYNEISKTSFIMTKVLV
jgi:hypothetical protein